MRGRKITVLGFGGCQLHPPISSTPRLQSAFWSMGLSNIACYNLAEALQTVRFFRGELSVPSPLRYYCDLPTNFDPFADKDRGIDCADIVMLEPNTPIETRFEGFAVNRGNLLTGIVNPLRERNSDLLGPTSEWFHSGLLGLRPDVIRRTAAELAPHVTGSPAEVELTRRMLYGTHAVQQDLAGLVNSIAELRDMLRLPMGIIAYTYQYLPDGRPISWPADHLANTIAAARRLGIPLYDPADLVRRHGVGIAYKDGGTTYRDEFLPIVADALADFAEEIILQSMPIGASKSASIVPSRA